MAVIFVLTRKCNALIISCLGSSPAAAPALGFHVAVQVRAEAVREENGRRARNTVHYEGDD